MIKVVSVKHYRVNPDALFQYSFVLLNEGFNPKVLLKGWPSERIMGQYSKHLKPFEPYQKGGKTIVTILDTETGIEYTGVAYCSMSDAFSYSKGRKIAVVRAVEDWLESTLGHLWK